MRAVLFSSLLAIFCMGAAGRFDLTASTDATDGLAAYRAQIAEALPGLDLNVRSLLAREAALWGAGVEGQMHQALIDAKVGSLRDISPLERYLFASHLSEFPVELGASEFAAAILEKPGSDERVVFYSSSSAASGTISGYESQIRSLQAEGWIFAEFVHNHPFTLVGYPNDKMSFGGSVAPSPTDVDVFLNYFAKMGLRRASITNGFSTVDLTLSDTQTLKSFQH